MLRAALLTAVMVSLTAAGALAQNIAIFAEIEGQVQGSISDGASQEDSIGELANGSPQSNHPNKVFVLGYNDELERSVDPNTGNVAATQPFVPKPVTLLKPIDRTTPLLKKALANIETLTIKVYFYQQNSRTGQFELLLTKEYTQCQVVEKKTIVLNQAEQSHHDLPIMEEVSFTFKQLSTTHEKTGVSTSTQFQ